MKAVRKETVCLLFCPQVLKHAFALPPSSFQSLVSGL